MKKIALFLALSLFCLVGFSQISKNDALKILNANPVANLKSIYIWGEYGNNDGKIDLTYSHYDAVNCTLEAWDSGLMLIAMLDGKKAQTFMPYIFISEIYADQDRISISLNK